jgi:hypothetical protein
MREIELQQTANSVGMLASLRRHLFDPTLPQGFFRQTGSQLPTNSTTVLDRPISDFTLAPTPLAPNSAALRELTTHIAADPNTFDETLAKM